ncbi:hypothetical protein M2347_001824 [Chryseobacterium sp. H1D6B]|uniref:hypothetical protein n=1 Tax=Chryseobacterium sp. H1D6B TaxID=2940588 RepID=UPI0015CE468A|nr:hypothetical protein [Chryseobacterium sp. H1D6B]MDH6252097.1 hypothetical protein [Chryseobacterium sp. H1D6B]
MKKIILAILLIVSSSTIYAQNTVRVNGPNSQIYYKVNSAEAGRALTYDEILGSPYLTKNFSLAKLADNYEKAPVRYNSFKDEVEFQKDGKTQVLPNTAQFSRIEILSPKQTIVLIDTNGLEGYFFELVNGKNSLYKKIKTNFIDIVPAQNSYATEKAATFKTLDPVYYIKTDKGIIKNPKNQKDIIEQLPERKEDLTTFFKANKIKFSKEEDLIKLVNFLNQ